MKPLFLFGFSANVGAVFAMYYLLPPEWRPWMFAAILALVGGVLATAWHRQDVERDKARLEARPQRVVQWSSRRAAPAAAKTDLRVVNHNDTPGEGRFTIGGGGHARNASS